MRGPARVFLGGLMGPCVGTSETVQAADSRLTRCVVGAALQIEVHSRPRLTASTESNKTAAATHVAPECGGAAGLELLLVALLLLLLTL